MAGQPVFKPRPLPNLCHQGEEVGGTLKEIIPRITGAGVPARKVRRDLFGQKMDTPASRQKGADNKNLKGL